MEPQPVILDVRTPQEYAQGHLEGARLVDYNAGEVDAEIPNLDPEAQYLVYCHAGIRAGMTTAQMRMAGFADVTSLGTLEDAAEATGLPIVR